MEEGGDQYTPPPPPGDYVCVQEDEKRQKTGKQLVPLQVDGSSEECVQSGAADGLVDFPFPRAVSPPPLLVQVTEVDEES